ncbi:MAG: hypothetical protein OXB98_02045 [Bryobacterales bacterium]|nr:hypothetical protein [Bryobacterales bacterium]
MKRAVMGAVASILALAVSFAENQRRELLELIGEVGSVEISGQAGTGTQTGVLVLGLRANPTGPFTTLFPMIPLTGYLDDIE